MATQEEDKGVTDSTQSWLDTGFTESKRGVLRSTVLDKVWSCPSTTSFCHDLILNANVFRTISGQMDTERWGGNFTYFQ